MKTMTPEDEIRAAAAKLRETAKDATRGPWIAYATPGDRMNDGHAWTLTRPYCDGGAPDRCEPDCGVTVLATGAEGCEDDNVREADARWMELAHPGLAEPLAAWLDWAANIARDHPWDLDYDGMPELRWCTNCQDEETSCVQAVDRALAVARVINGGQE